MKRITAICILATVLFCCANIFAQTAGTDVTAEDLSDFYYTYSHIGYNAEYQRYRFYEEDGKYFFFHEERGTENDYGYNTEDDILSSGIRELTEKEWAAFFALLEGGTLTERSEDVTDGDSGPWLFLYRKGDKTGMEYTFASYAAQCEFVEFCEGLAEEPLTAAGLVSCEYSVYGGMENENTTFTVTWAADPAEGGRLILDENGNTEERVLSRDVLEELAMFLAGYHPEKWKSLPDREYFALDAPGRRIILTYEDGTEYSTDNDKEQEGPLFGELERLLQKWLTEEDL